jgi:hypothetical protein
MDYDVAGIQEYSREVTPAAQAQQRAGGDGGTRLMFQAGVLLPAAPQHERWPTTFQRIGC